MQPLSILIQLVIAAGIFNVWVLRFNKPTPWRPKGATNLREEFARYGLPDWMRSTVGVAKLSLAALLVVGIWIPSIAGYAAAGLALLMLGALVAHARIRDPLMKSLPAFSLFALCLFVTAASGII